MEKDSIDLLELLEKLLRDKERDEILDLLHTEEETNPVHEENESD